MTEVRPEVLFAVKDIVLDELPERATLEVLADEEYWALLNGSPVGAGRYRPGAPRDRYDVTALLRTGTNRLVIEGRSARGTGGLIAQWTVAGARRTRHWSTGSDWGIARAHEGAFLDPEAELSSLEPPLVWGAPPIGRWGSLAEVRDLPLTTEVRASERGTDPERFRQGQRIRGWRRFVRQRRAPEPLGSWVAFDWGREVTGYVSLAFAAPREELGVGLLWTGMAPTAFTVGIDPRVDTYDTVVLAAPGRNWWTDAVPRRFRYLYVLGLEDLALAEVYTLREAVDAPRAAVVPHMLGVWGLDPRG